LRARSVSALAWPNASCASRHGGAPTLREPAGRSAERTSIVLVSVGGAAVVAGAVTWWLGWRALRVEAAPDRVALSFTTRF
jgi:hypothetical protein